MQVDEEESYFGQLLDIRKVGQNLPWNESVFGAVLKDCVEFQAVTASQPCPASNGLLQSPTQQTHMVTT